MLPNLPIAITKAPPTALDSLKQSISKLENTVDSLHKVVFKTEIAGDYFYQIMLLQLTVFVLIIGFGGWFGWGSIVKKLSHDRKELLKEADEIISDKADEINQAIEDVKEVGNRTTYNSTRSMYLLFKGKSELTSFQWAIASAASRYLMNKNDTKSTIIWLLRTKTHIGKIPHGIKGLKDYKNRFEIHVTALSMSTDPQTLKLLDEIINLFYGNFYSLKQTDSEIKKFQTTNFESNN